MQVESDLAAQDDDSDDDDDTGKIADDASDEPAADSEATANGTDEAPGEIHE